MDRALDVLVAEQAESPSRNRAAIGVDWSVPVPESFRLDSGEPAPDGRFQTRLYGQPKAPLVIVAGGISAGRMVSGPEGEGWWPDVVGRGAGIDLEPNRLAVFAIDIGPPFVRKGVDQGKAPAAHRQLLSRAGNRRYRITIGDSDAQADAIKRQNQLQLGLCVPDTVADEFGDE